MSGNGGMSPCRAHSPPVLKLAGTSGPSWCVSVCSERVHEGVHVCQVRGCERVRLWVREMLLVGA